MSVNSAGEITPGTLSQSHFIPLCVCACASRNSIIMETASRSFVFTGAFVLCPVESELYWTVAFRTLLNLIPTLMDNFKFLISDLSSSGPQRDIVVMMCYQGPISIVSEHSHSVFIMRSVAINAVLTLFANVIHFFCTWHVKMRYR
jgi:hypothetical protein